MLKKILNLFILLSFCLVVEAGHNFSNEDGEHSNMVNDNSLSQVVSTLEDPGCEDEDCHDESDHCLHHCSGLHNLSATTHKIVLNYPSSQEGKMSWFFINLYKRPSPEPAKRPPVHS